jgi:hypothetical protein
MSDILAQLKSLGVTLGMPDKPAVPKSQPGDVFQALEKAFPNGFTNENTFGPYFINRCTYPASYTHGCVHLDHELSKSRMFSSIVGLSEIRKEDTLAMDTETSGLSADASSFVFMIGMGYYSANQYIVDQLILPDLIYEKAFLHQTEIIFARFPVLLTYNGKSFDIPMIRSRCNFHFFPDFCSDMHHVDFLPIARKYWRKTLPNCRLSTLEQEVLKIRRGEAEVPGFMAPEIYRDFLNTTDGTALKGVAYHNEIDVMSLSAFLVFLGKITQTGMYNPDLLSECHLSVPDFYRNTIPVDPENADITPLLNNSYFSIHEKKKTAGILKKMGAFEKSLHIYTALAENGDIASCYEAASLYEKNFQNHQDAITFLLKGVSLIEKDDTIGTWSKKEKLNQFRIRIDKIREKAKQDV